MFSANHAFSSREKKGNFERLQQHFLCRLMELIRSLFVLFPCPKESCFFLPKKTFFLRQFRTEVTKINGMGVK
jgi:hypothetical protein